MLEKPIDPRDYEKCPNCEGYGCFEGGWDMEDFICKQCDGKGYIKIKERRNKMKRILSFLGHWLIGSILIWSAFPLALISCITIVSIFASVYNWSINPVLNEYTKLFTDFSEAIMTGGFRVYTFIMILMGIPYGWEKSTEVADESPDLPL